MQNLNLLLLLMLIRKKKRKIKQQKRINIKPRIRNIFAKGEIFDEYHHLLSQLRSGDREFCLRYPRMNTERFDQKIKLTKENIRFRKSLKACC